MPRLKVVEVTECAQQKFETTIAIVRMAIFWMLQVL